MPKLLADLIIDTCPHCGVNSPNLQLHTNVATHSKITGRQQVWGMYICQRCGSAVLASADTVNSNVNDIIPKPAGVDPTVPERPREYLRQAINSIHAPAGAIMLAASSVDAMLKEKGYTEGSLYSRIQKASEDHLITPEMENWAHEVRLDANDQRHADIGNSLPKEEDAKRCINFAQALAQFLFILPALVKRGRTNT